METRRNFLKKVGLMGIVSALPFENVNLPHKNKFQRLHGSDFIEKTLREYKKELPVTYSSAYSDGSGNPVAYLKDGTEFSYGCLKHSNLKGSDPLLVRKGWNSSYTNISKNEKGFYFIEFNGYNIKFDEEKKALFPIFGATAIMPLPNSKEYFAPFKELYNLVWEDVKLYIKNK